MLTVRPFPRRKRYTFRPPEAPPRAWETAWSPVDGGKGIHIGQRPPRSRKPPPCPSCGHQGRKHGCSEQGCTVLHYPPGWGWTVCAGCKYPLGHPSNRSLKQAISGIEVYSGEEGWRKIPGVLAQRFARVLGRAYHSPPMVEFLLRYERRVGKVWSIGNEVDFYAGLAHLAEMWRRSCNPGPVERALRALSRAPDAKGSTVRMRTPWVVSTRPIPRVVWKPPRAHRCRQDCPCPTGMARALDRAEATVPDPHMASMLTMGNYVRKRLGQPPKAPVRTILEPSPYTTITPPPGPDHTYSPTCTCYYCRGVPKPIMMGTIIIRSGDL